MYACFVCFQACDFSANCARRGIHAHHPRDCLFFLRDWDTVRLQQLLRENNVNYEAGVRGLPVQGMRRPLQRNIYVRSNIYSNTVVSTSFQVDPLKFAASCCINLTALTASNL